MNLTSARGYGSRRPSRLEKVEKKPKFNSQTADNKYKPGFRVYGCVFESSNDPQLFHQGGKQRPIGTMNAIPPIVSGHTGFGSTGLQLILASRDQVREVAQFQARPRDFRAPRMQLSSSLPAAPLAEMQTRFDIRA